MRRIRSRSSSFMLTTPFFRVAGGCEKRLAATSLLILSNPIQPFASFLDAHAELSSSPQAKGSHPRPVNPNSILANIQQLSWWTRSLRDSVHQFRSKIDTQRERKRFLLLLPIWESSSGSTEAHPEVAPREGSGESVKRTKQQALCKQALRW
jgi:hypothetical protein